MKIRIKTKDWEPTKLVARQVPPMSEMGIRAAMADKDLRYFRHYGPPPDANQRFM